jgi:catalase (peroxidase I)
MLNETAHAGIGLSIASGTSRPRNVITNPDLIALAAVVTVGHCGGPVLGFEYGRKQNPKPIHPAGRVPEDTDSYSSIKARLRVMRMSNEDIVALVMGAHTLGCVFLFPPPVTVFLC